MTTWSLYALVFKQQLCHLMKNWTIWTVLFDICAFYWQTGITCYILIQYFTIFQYCSIITVIFYQMCVRHICTNLWYSKSKTVDHQSVLIKRLHWVLEDSESWMNSVQCMHIFDTMVVVSCFCLLFCVFSDPEIVLAEDARKNPCRQFLQTGERV